MKRLVTIIQRRSLTFSIVALVIGLGTLGRVLDDEGWARAGGSTIGHARSGGPTFVVDSIAICVVAFAICTAVLVNLVLDVNRGYSPQRCSLAAVVMLVAFAGPLLLAFNLLKYYS